MTFEQDNRSETSSEMTRRAFLRGALVVAGGVAVGGVWTPAEAQTAAAAPVADKPVLYLIATAHNDTQWNWTVQHTINDCVPNTMHGNWALFEQFPDYVFNYEGGIHYMFFQEYHPDEWATLQKWVRAGRWKLSGAWLNAVDVNIPSPESLFRHALYGQGFFQKEFGTVSRDVYLPDCFGFGYALPTIAKHSGLLAFSTQKLSWGGWIPAPFAVGRWQGVDGSEVVAALRGGSYNARIRTDIATDSHWNSDLDNAGDRKVGFRYFGVGDEGGAPDPESVQFAETAMHDTAAPVHVRNTSADQLAKDLTPAEVASLPQYQGELIMKTHGSGCYTSQAAMKRWNRRNEQLGDAAERASVAADWLGGPAYPREKLRDAWIRTLWHQAHDDLTGTCIPQAYTFSWNDEVIALNQFSRVLTTGVGAVASGLDTRVQGVPLVVYNALAQPRRDVVEAEVTLPANAAPHVRVFDTATGKEIPSQTLARYGSKATILILADAPSVGYTVYDVRPSHASCALKTGLIVTPDSLENARYHVSLDANGNISSLKDKKTGREYLKAPAPLQLLHDPSPDWAAWEVKWEAMSAPPRATLNQPTVRVVENGPVRVALEVTRKADGSTFVQHLRLTPGGEWVEVHNDWDWKTPGTLVKAAFPMTASSPTATFDLGVGTIERPNAEPNRYEVPAQQWMDLTDAGGAHGLAILNDGKYGCDKPADDTLRLTLVRTPDPQGNWIHQGTNDLGRHTFTYALAPHDGDWRAGRIPARAARLNQPLVAFQPTAHPGSLGRTFSLLRVSSEQVAVTAVKKAEGSHEYVVRVQELHGRPVTGARVAFAAPVVAVREINAAEEAVGPYRATQGVLRFDLTAYQPRTFAVTLAPAAHRLARTHSAPLALAFTHDGVSTDKNRSDGNFDGHGLTMPAELFPSRLVSDGVEFHLGSGADGAKNVLACQGQTVTLPAGGHDRLYLLAASVGGDESGVFTVHTSSGQSHTIPLKVQEWTGLIGQWDSRLAYNFPDGGDQVVSLEKDGTILGLDKLRPAFIKRDPIAWVGTHRHSPAENEARMFCYLFQYRLALPPGAHSVTLPQNDKIRILAITAARQPADDTAPATLLYD